MKYYKTSYNKICTIKYKERKNNKDISAHARKTMSQVCLPSNLILALRLHVHGMWNGYKNWLWGYHSQDQSLAWIDTFLWILSNKVYFHELFTFWTLNTHYELESGETRKVFLKHNCVTCRRHKKISTWSCSHGDCFRENLSYVHKIQYNILL